MKYAKFVAFGILASLTLAIISALVTEDGDAGYTIAGLGFFVFGIWASVLLLRYENPNEK